MGILVSARAKHVGVLRDVQSSELAHVDLGAAAVLAFLFLCTTKLVPRKVAQESLVGRSLLSRCARWLDFRRRRSQRQRRAHAEESHEAPARQAALDQTPRVAFLRELPIRARSASVGILLHWYSAGPTSRSASRYRVSSIRTGPRSLAGSPTFGMERRTCSTSSSAHAAQQGLAADTSELGVFGVW